jgi:hypothetical protein
MYITLLLYGDRAGVIDRRSKGKCDQWSHAHIKKERRLTKVT